MVNKYASSRGIGVFYQTSDRELLNHRPNISVRYFLYPYHLVVCRDGK